MCVCDNVRVETKIYINENIMLFCQNMLLSGGLRDDMENRKFGGAMHQQTINYQRRENSAWYLGSSRSVKPDTKVFPAQSPKYA